MKKIIAVVLISILGSICFFYDNEPHIDIEKGIKSGSYSLHVNVPESDGVRVSFSQTGKFNDQKFTGSGFVIKNSNAKGSVIALLEEIEPLGMKQFLLPFFVNYGGSGTFLYIGLFDIEKKSIHHLDSIFIGDRVALLNLSSQDNLEALLEYNGYKRGRSMSTIPDNYTKISLFIKDKKLLKVGSN